MNIQLVKQGLGSRQNTAFGKLRPALPRQIVAGFAATLLVWAVWLPSIRAAERLTGHVLSWGQQMLPLVSPNTRFNAIAAGYRHNIAIKQDGTVVAWGENDYGKAIVPSGLSGVTAVAGGISHSLALKQDGTVVAWGEANVPSGLSNVVAIAAGGYHSLALKQDGTLVGWGDNSFGCVTAPSGLSGVRAIATGDLWFSLALKQDGTVLAWGYNGDGETNVPSGLSGVIAIAAGSGHSLALKQDGTVVAWGKNDFGQTDVPPALSGSRVVAVAAGSRHSLALKQDGTVVAWGYNPPSGNPTDVPVGLNGVIAVAARGDHNLALKQDGTLVAWGDNAYGDVMVPTDLGGVIALAGPSLALKQDGTVLGLSTDTPRGLSGVTGIATSGSHSLALKQDRTVVAWGYNGQGQTNVPGGLTAVIAIAAGASHSLALKQDGTVVAWGENDSGQTNVPRGLSGVTAIAGGSDYSLALKQDGTVLAWGTIWNGQNRVPATVPSDLSGVIAIAAGADHSLAIKRDGTVLAWGNNQHGQTNVPPELSRGEVVAIAAGWEHSLALKRDGTVVAWGAGAPGRPWNPAVGDYGQSTVAPGLVRVGTISGGWSSSLVLVYGPLAPTIFIPPQTQTAEEGSSVGLRVGVDGFPPLSYQWFFNETNGLSGGTNSYLDFLSVRPSQAGAYAVAISNMFGVVTSASASLSVIAPVPERTVPALNLTGELGSSLHLSFADGLNLDATWQELDAVTLTTTPQICFDLSAPLSPARFYRAWQTNLPSALPSLELRWATEISLTGAIGSHVRIDYINQFGPTDAWVTLDTVTLTNTSQLYYDLSMFRRPTRLYRLVPVP